MTIEQACAVDGYCTISEGTRRPQDLIPKYLDALREIAPAAYEQIVMPGCGFSAYPAYAAEDMSSEWWDSSSCKWLLESLTDALDEHAPEGFIFRSHDGDGAHMGFWSIDTDE